MFNKRSIIRKAVSCTMMALFAAAMIILCKKEHEQYSYTGIYSFSFSDNANGRNGIAYINTDSCTIEVNWLYEWKSPDSIEPVIALAPGATMSQPVAAGWLLKMDHLYRQCPEWCLQGIYFQKNIKAAKACICIYG